MLPTLNKTVSIIVPCYKYAHYLEECVDSIVRQTYSVLEIIIVDDGSPDNTIPVANSLRMKYPTLVRLVSKENGGLASARNAGIEIAQGEYIMCLDADDKLVPAAIEEHVKLMDNDMAIAQCSLMEFGERHVVFLANPGTNLERVMQSNTIFCNAMFSKRMWELSGGYDESETMRLGYEDWEFWIQLLALGCHVNTSDFIALRYRCHEGQMTQATSHPNRQKLYNYIYKKHKDLYDDKNLLVADLILEK